LTRKISIADTNIYISRIKTIITSFSRIIPLFFLFIYINYSHSALLMFCFNCHATHFFNCLWGIVLLQILLSFSHSGTSNRSALIFYGILYGISEDQEGLNLEAHYTK